MKTCLTAVYFIIMIFSNSAQSAEAQSCTDLFISPSALVVNPLLGTVKEPSLQNKNFYKNLIFALKFESQFPSVARSDLDIQSQLNVGGRGNKSILLARYHNQKVIVKISDALMRSEDTASFLFGIIKRGRKYYLGVSTITQDVSDFLNSPYGLPMITNSSIQLLLRQSPTSVDLVQQTFKLSDEEKYLLLESDVGEGIFFAGLKHVALKIIASYTEDQIITSDPSQILAIKKAKQELSTAGDVTLDSATKSTQ